MKLIVRGLQRLVWSLVAILLHFKSGLVQSGVVINNDLEDKCYWDNTTSPVIENYVNSQNNISGHVDNNITVKSNSFKPLKGTIALNSSQLIKEETIDPVNITIPNSESQNNTKKMKTIKQQCFNSYTSVMLELIKPEEVASECRHNVTRDAKVEDDVKEAEEQQLDKDHDRDWKKNFAGHDCGAKIFAASDEIKNPADLIKKNHDEYMLSECIDNLWIVIELCENMRIARIEVDNSELYSGGPKDFTISVTDKYSKNPKDWNLIGTFQAQEDKKIVQHFKINKPEYFGKYVLLNFLTNYANEHYCTLTSFRAFGLTEYEFLSEQAEAEEEELAKELEPEIIAPVESEAQKKLKRIADELKKTKNNTNVEENLCTTSPFSPSWPFTVFTYKYVMYLNDYICLDSRAFLTKGNKVISDTLGTQEIVNSEITTNNVSDTTSESSATTEKKNNEVKDSTSVPITPNSSEVEQTNTQMPKESVLVQISKRLKTLEKNVTLVNRLLNTLNNTNTDQSDDILHILEEVVKAQDTFQSSIQENEAISETVKNLSEKLSIFESVVNEKSLAIMWLTIANVMLFLLIFLFVTCACARKMYRNVRPVKIEEPHSILKKSSAYECGPCITDNNNQEDHIADRVKKLSFSLEELEDEEADDEVAEIPFSKAAAESLSNIENHFLKTAEERLMRRSSKGHRRCTWSGGSLKKLAQDGGFMSKDV